MTAESPPHPPVVFIPGSAYDAIRASNAAREERAAAFAALARIDTLSMIAYAGSGHIGSSFSALDIMSWLHLFEMRLAAVGSPTDEQVGEDVFFSSKGHDAPALYAVLAGLGRIDRVMLTQLRRLGGLPGHPDVTATAAIKANTGSLGMGISKAKGLAIADRQLGRKRRIYVLTGDGELQEGQIWESLGSAVGRQLSEITVIVDHNKVQSDTYVKDTADLGDLMVKFRAFGWHVMQVDGHNLHSLGAALAEARHEETMPSAIIADTIKGRGVSFMEHTAMDGPWYHFHSGAPSATDYSAATEELIEKAKSAYECVTGDRIAFVEKSLPVRLVPSSEQVRLVPAYGEALVALAKEDRRIIALDADLVLDTGLLPFRDALPNRLVECGIAEQDMVSQASGMALAGLLPVVHSFACFLTPRANEQVFNAASEHTRIIYVGALAGCIPAGPGHSHQSVRDIALMASVPGMDCIEPSTIEEVECILRWAIQEAPSNVYIRLVSVPVERLPGHNGPLTPGRGTIIRAGSDVALIGYGPILIREALNAADALDKDGISARVISLPWLNRLDNEWLLAAVEGCRGIITLDNHLLEGGQGRRLASALRGLGKQTPLTSLGLNTIPVCGTNAETLAYHELDAEAIADKTFSLLLQT